MTCPNCGQPNPVGKKFCSQCGTKLALACPTCGAALDGSERFCGECGTPVGTGTLATRPASITEPIGSAPPASERRHVSVLFADLVGFTTLSEQRDPEEVRELLTRYFETARQLIARYGGNIEKFIGDAVMAVWGTPVAREDDSERAVRAAIDLVAAVTALGSEVGADLRLRAGVMTGETAVSVGAEGQGMVAGDLVNTAARVQAVAAPGTVFVGETTRRATEAAIAYEDAGEFELKGKAEALPLWRAVRVVAALGGLQRTSGLEAPFVGRDREIRLVKEMLHASSEERKAHLVSVMGVAGVGKTRLSWEFEKYVDGLADDVWWHRGRCLSYGEGVAYWALAEMVRMRAQIVEDEEPEAAQAKLRAAIEEHVHDPEEQRWLEPRLAHLLGLEERVVRDPQDLFAAWRLFFERLAETLPIVMVFEDLQWADTALLDFIEYLLEWSREYPLFILTLARPELSERRPTWGAGKRNSSSLFLEPLPPAAMEELLQGLVPGLPPDVRSQILERAEGIPLYAVETVRMLLDRDLLVQDGNEYRLAGELEALEVPETLHALIAARLDGLSAQERMLIQDASVLGKVFTRPAVAALTGISDAEVEGVLTSLVRKEFLSVQTDPRSPERGQYGFLQDLVRKVAYDTLSKRERKAKHLAVVATLEATWGADEPEIAEVLASHCLEAYRAAPDAPDAGEIRNKAREALAKAGQRAAALAATEEAQRYFEQAAGLADDPLARAGLVERAATMAGTGGRGEAALALFQESKDLFEAQGEAHAAARVSAKLGEVMWDRGRLREAVEEMDRSFQVLKDDPPDEDLAMLAAQVGRFFFFAGERDLAAERIEQALEIAEPMWFPEVLSQALNTKSLILLAKGRRREGIALLKYALEVALENDLGSAALRAYNNLSELVSQADQYEEARDIVGRGLSLARKLGNRFWERILLGQSYPLMALGDWDQVLAQGRELAVENISTARGAFLSSLGVVPQIHLARGDLEGAKRPLKLFEDARDSDDVQERSNYALGTALIDMAEGHPADALAHAIAAMELSEAQGWGSETAKEAFGAAVEAALALGDTAKAEELISFVEDLPPGYVPQMIRAHCSRFRGRLAAIEGAAERAEQEFKAAAGSFRELATPFPLAVTQLEYAEWLVQEGRAEEAAPLLSEARGTFERLGATPWLERVDRAGAGRLALEEAGR
jgi:class 3 adenylate cyclase/tetratricopeptide (TPR) repeat protein